MIFKIPSNLNHSIILGFYDHIVLLTQKKASNSPVQKVSEMFEMLLKLHGINWL